LLKERLGVEYEKHRAQYRTLENAHDNDDDDDVGLNVL